VVRGYPLKRIEVRGVAVGPQWIKQGIPGTGLMEGGGQDADGDGNIQIGGDGVVATDVSDSIVAGGDVNISGIVLNDSPGSTVSLGITSIGTDEFRQIMREELDRNTEKHIKPIESSNIENLPNFLSEPYTIMSLLGGQKAISVPNYQRDFVWKAEQVIALLQNFVMDSRDTHIGSVLLLDGESESYEVMDGAQRLYALTIILSAIRDYLWASGFYNVASSIHTGTIADYFGGPKFIPHKRHREYFLKSIHSFPDSDFSNPEIDSGKNIEQSYKMVMEELDYLNPEFVVDRVDQVMKSRVIVTIFEDAGDAYDIFTTINSESVPLSEKDIELLRRNMTEKVYSAQKNTLGNIIIVNDVNPRNSYKVVFSGTYTECLRYKTLESTKASQG
jgi:uncharacterized protein with ParB-like and HNH nuclease domain